MMSNFSSEERKIVAEKWMEWGNLVFVGSTIAHFASGASAYHWNIVFGGMLALAAGYLGGVMLMRWKGGEKN
jgi:predicted permease